MISVRPRDGAGSHSRSREFAIASCLQSENRAKMCRSKKPGKATPRQNQMWIALARAPAVI